MGQNMELPPQKKKKKKKCGQLLIFFETFTPRGEISIFAIIKYRFKILIL